MIAHLTGSSRDSGKDLPYLRQIIKTLYGNGVEIAHNWVETSNITVRDQPDKIWDWQDIVSANIEALKRSDIVIVEITSYAFFQGYQIAIALSFHKPVLAVSRKPLGDLAIAGIDDELLSLKEYSDESELQKVVAGFVQKHTIAPQGKIVSIAVDTELNSYLRSQELRTGKSRDELLLALAKGGIPR